MAVIAKFGADGLSDGATLNTSLAGTGDTSWGAIGGEAPTISDSGPRSPRIKFSQPSGSASFISWGSSKLGGSHNVISLRTYVEMTGVAASGWTLLEAFSGSETAYKIAVAGDGGVANQLRIREGNDTQHGETPIGLEVDTVYRVEVLFGHGSVMVNVYEGEGRTLYTRADTNNTIGPVPATSVSKVAFGPPSSTPTVPTFYLDDILVQDTFAEGGPVGPFGTPTLSLWTGSEEIYLIGEAP